MINPLKSFNRWRAQRRAFKEHIENALGRQRARQLGHNVRKLLDNQVPLTCAMCGERKPLGRVTVTAPLCMFTVTVCEPCFHNLKKLEIQGGPEYIATVARLIEWGQQ